MNLEFEADGVPNELLPVPCGWRVLIAPVKLREVTEGGIALPQVSLEIAENFRNIAKVLAIGDSAYDDPAFRGGRADGVVRPWCKVGDVVSFNCHDGEAKHIFYQGKKHKLITISDRGIVDIFPDTSIIEALL